MKIGIAYDLRTWYLEQGFGMEETAEFDKESTIEGIEKVIASLGFETERIGNIYQIVERLGKGERWDLVFNITESLYGDGRESAVPALLDQYKIPYTFSGPVTLGIALNKYYSRLIAKEAGVKVAPGTIIYDGDEIDAKTQSLVFPLFLKPVAEGTGKGITAQSKVSNTNELKSICGEMLNNYHQPVLIEEYLPGREFTVGIVGNGASAHCVGAMEIICKDNLPYCNEVKENFEQYVEYRLIPENDLAEKCYATAKNAWIAINGVDAGRIDLRIDRNGEVCFIEANPLAGLNPVISDLPILCRLNGVSYEQLIGEIIDSAIKRTKKRI